MTTYYGSYVTAATYNRVRVRLDVTLTYPGGSLDTTDTSCTVNWTIRLHKHPDDPSGSYCNDTSDWTMSGDHAASGATAWELTGPNDTDVIASGTDTHPLSYGSSSPWDVSVVVDHRVLSGAPSISVSHPVPARPYATPAAPSALTATRVSDTQQTIAWTRNATTGAPYDNIEVWRQINGGTFSKIATLAGTATSYSASTSAGNRYGFKVRAVNDAGTSGYSNTDSISTTPPAPAAPTWTVEADGDVVVARPSSLPYVVNQWRVWHATDGIWDANELATVAAGTTTWTHTAPNPAQTHQYRLTYLSTDPVLESAYGTASTVLQLQAPPNAPTNLAPTVADGTAQIVFTWTHNPVDGTPQTAYEFQHRPVGGTYAGTGKVTSATSSYTMAAGTLANGTQREWRVRTWGAHADPSAYSVDTILTLSGEPSAGITSPSGTWNTKALTVTWTYSDPESTAQSAWEAELVEGGVTIGTKSGSGTATSTTFAEEVADGGTYTVRVRVKDGSGLWSLWASETFTVTYDPPPTPAVTAAWYTDDGYVTAHSTVLAPGTGERPVDHVRVDRLDADGVTWVLVADDLPDDAIVTDYTAPTATTVTYRATAVSDIGSEASATVDVTTDTRWMFVNYGDGFALSARFDTELSAGRGFEPTKVLRHYLDRPAPVVRTGPAEDETYKANVTIFPWVTDDPQSGWNDVRAFAREAVVCVRDPRGVRLFATVTNTDLGAWLEWESSLAVEFRVVDHTEPVPA